MTEHKWLEAIITIAEHVKGEIQLTNDQVISALETVNSYRPEHIDNFDLICMMQEIENERKSQIEINKAIAKLDM